MRRRSAAATVAVAAVLAQPAAARALDRDFTYAGTGCHESVVLATVPGEHAQELLPAGYVAGNLAGAPGAASVGVATLHCEQMWLDGSPLAEPILSDVGISIQSPDGSAGTHWYALWQVQGSRPLATAMRRAGLAGAHVPGISGSVNGMKGIGDVPWTTSAYHLEVDAPAPVQGETPDTGNTWWHEGTRGRIRLSYFFPRSSAEGGLGVLSRMTGPLADLLGGSSAPGAGLLVHCDFRARVDVQSRPERWRRRAARATRRGTRS